MAVFCINVERFVSIVPFAEAVALFIGERNFLPVYHCIPAYKHLIVLLFGRSYRISAAELYRQHFIRQIGVVTIELGIVVPFGIESGYAVRAVRYLVNRLVGKVFVFAPAHQRRAVPVFKHGQQKSFTLDVIGVSVVNGIVNYELERIIYRVRPPCVVIGYVAVRYGVYRISRKERAGIPAEEFIASAFGLIVVVLAAEYNYIFCIIIRNVQRYRAIFPPYRIKRYIGSDCARELYAARGV